MKWHKPLAVGLLMTACFALGSALPTGELLQQLGAWLAGPRLEAQGGRGPVTPPPPPEPTFPPGGAGTTPGEPAAPRVVYSEEGGQAAAANGFVAVTGSYGVGTSVLYLVDTVNRQLAVYEARGGSAAQRRVVLVGARKIDLDLELEGYNDRSEYPYRRLRGLFESRGKESTDVTTGLQPSGR